MKLKVTAAVIVVISLLFLAGSVINFFFAKKLGAEFGRNTGNVVGIAVGSFDGAVKGLNEGYDAGVAVAISAEDTVVKLGNEIKEIGLLEVLQMDVTLTDVFEQKNYSALLVFEGNARYTVDLTKCNITCEGETIKIFAPKPVLHVSIDPRGTQKRAESSAITLAQKINDGNTLNAYQAFLNTLEVTENKVRENLTNYETLTASAEKSAKTAIENLARSAVLNGKYVVVSLFDDGENSKIIVEG